jgi:hypothetical protein
VWHRKKRDAIHSLYSQPVGQKCYNSTGWLSMVVSSYFSSIQSVLGSMISPNKGFR